MGLSNSGYFYFNLTDSSKVSTNQEKFPTFGVKKLMWTWYGSRLPVVSVM